LASSKKSIYASYSGRIYNRARPRRIQPIIDFDLQINTNTKPDDLKVLLSAYSRWGAKFILFFKSPNVKSSWVEGTWSQGDLVERFLDRYIPFVRVAEQNGLTPVFPPLQPGGDYWDLSFLKKVLHLCSSGIR